MLRAFNQIQACTNAPRPVSFLAIQTTLNLIASGQFALATSLQHDLTTAIKQVASSADGSMPSPQKFALLAAKVDVWKAVLERATNEFQMASATLLAYATCLVAASLCHSAVAQILIIIRSFLDMAAFCLVTRARPPLTNSPAAAGEDRRRPFCSARVCDQPDDGAIWAIEQTSRIHDGAKQIGARSRPDQATTAPLRQSHPGDNHQLLGQLAVHRLRL